MISKMSSIALILIYFAITYQGNIFTGKFKDLFNKSVKEGSFVVAICGRVVNMIILRTLRVSNTNAIIDCMAFRGGEGPFLPSPYPKEGSDVSHGSRLDSLPRSRFLDITQRSNVAAARETRRRNRLMGLGGKRRWGGGG